MLMANALSIMMSSTGELARGRIGVKARSDSLRGWFFLAMLFAFAALVLSRWWFVFGDRVGATTPEEVSGTLRDFRDTIWLPAKDLLSGFNPYDTPAYLERHPFAQGFNFYLPSHLTATGILGVFPWTAAALIWLLVLLTTTVYIACLALRAARLPRTPALVLLLTLVLSLWPYFLQGLRLGQVTIVVAAAAITVLMAKKEEWLVAACTALALFKPQYGLPLLIILVMDGRLRTALRGILLTCVLALPVLIAASVDAGGPLSLLESFRRNLASAGEQTFQGAAKGNGRVDPLGAISNWLGYLPPTALEVLALLFVSVVGALAYRQLRRSEGYLSQQLALVAGSTTIAMAPTHWRYDLVVLSHR